MTGKVLISPRPDVRESRYGRDFYEQSVGFGRIQETASEGMPSNTVGRVLVMFKDRGDLEAVDTKEVHGAPSDYFTFRRQVAHSEIISGAIAVCIEEAESRTETNRQSVEQVD